MSKLPLQTMAAATVLLVALSSCAPENDSAQKYRAMQAAYEGRIAEMQRAYDELNGLLVLAEERLENQLRNEKTRGGRDGRGCKEDASPDDATKIPTSD